MIPGVSVATMDQDPATTVARTENKKEKIVRLGREGEGRGGEVKRE